VLRWRENHRGRVGGYPFLELRGDEVEVPLHVRGDRVELRAGEVEKMLSVCHDGSS